MGFLSKLISKDDEETDEEKKKKKEKDDEIVYVKVGGEDIPVAKGDMKDDEWQAVVKAAKQDVQPKTGDSIVVKGDDGSDLIIPKGDIDDDAWEQLKKNAKTRGSLVQGDQRDQARASDIEALPARRGGDVGRTYATDREEEDEDARTKDREGIRDIESLESLPARRGGDIGRAYSLDEEENTRGRVEIGEPEIGKARKPRGRVDIGDVEFRDPDFGPTRKEYKDHNPAVRMAEDMILGQGEKKQGLTDVMHPPLSDREKYVQRKISEYTEEVGKPTSEDIKKFYDNYDKREGAQKSKSEKLKQSIRDEEASIEGEGRARNPAVRMAQDMMLGATPTEEDRLDPLPVRRGGDVGTPQATSAESEAPELSGAEAARAAGIKYGGPIRFAASKALEPVGAAVDIAKAIPGAVEKAGAFAQGVFDPEGATKTNEQAQFVGPPPELAGKGTMPASAQAPTPVQAAAPVPTNRSASMGMSARMGRGGPEIPMPKDRSGEMESAYGDAQKAMRMNADLEAQGLKAKGQAFDAQVNEGIRQKAKLAEIEERKRKEVEKPMSIYNGFMSQLMQPSEKIDPNRWVNSRSTGQKVLLVLGAMFTKGGNVDMIRKAIDADIDAQKSDIAANRDRIKTGLQASQNLVQMARDQGADDVQAAKIAYAVECDIVANRLQMITANTDSQEIKQKADQAIAEMNVQKSKALTEMDRYSTDLAIRKAHVQNEYDEVQLKRAEAWRRANAPAKGPKEERIKGAQMQKIAAIDAAIAKINSLKQDFNKNNRNVGESLINKVAGAVPRSGSSRFNYSSELNVANIADELGRAGVLQKHDLERWRGLSVTAGDLDGKYKLNKLGEDLQTRRDALVNDFKSGGYAVGDLASEAPKTFQPDAEEGESE